MARPDSDPSAWKLPWHGSCRCGRSTLTVTEPPLLTSACHCSGCQKMSASAFSLTVAVPSSGFATGGLEPEVGGLHGDAVHSFCPWCKSWMYSRMTGMDEFVNVRASMLDDHRWVEPFVAFWTSEAYPWARTPAVEQFDTQPPLDAFPALIERFAREGRRP